MKFTVTWRNSAQDRLAELWTNDADPSSIAAAADEIDRRLANEPLTDGESRWLSTRILIVEPLAIYYDVSEPDRRVSVWSVWKYAT